MDKGHGGALLADASQRIVAATQIVGDRFIVVDAASDRSPTPYVSSRKPPTWPHHSNHEVSPHVSMFVDGQYGRAGTPVNERPMRAHQRFGIAVLGGSTATGDRITDAKLRFARVEPVFSWRLRGYRGESKSVKRSAGRPPDTGAGSRPCMKWYELRASHVSIAVLSAGYVSALGSRLRIISGMVGLMGVAVTTVAFLAARRYDEIGKRATDPLAELQGRLADALDVQSCRVPDRRGLRFLGAVT
jgi:hypothetical protein